MTTGHDQVIRWARWLVLAWLGLVVSGALTTGALRASLPTPWIAPLSYQFHVIGALVVGVLTMTAIVRVRPRRAATWICVALAGLAVLTGWHSARSFAPIAGAAHAFSAALAAVGVLVACAWVPRPAGPGAAIALRPAWIPVTVQLAFGVAGVQVAGGALLRHQQIGLAWHLVSGGLTVITLLAPSVAMLQVPGLPGDERRAARGAIAAVVVQAALGAAVWLMILVGPVPVGGWLAATVAHVTGGTVTLMAAARLAWVVTLPDGQGGYKTKRVIRN